MHLKNDNIKIIICDKTIEVTQQPFKLVLSEYQRDWQKLMKSCGFIFDCDIFINYKCHEMNLKRGGSCIDYCD